MGEDKFTPTQPDWREEALKLINEFGRMYYLVSEENWHESNESKARQDVIDFIQSVADTSYEAGFYAGRDKVLEKSEKAVDTFRKKAIEELEKMKVWYGADSIPDAYVLFNEGYDKAIQEAQDKLREL